MSRRRTGLLTAIAVGAGLCLGLSADTAAAQAPPAEDSSCIACHREQQGSLRTPVDLVPDSVHGRVGVSCHDCHGGDLEDERLAHSPGAGFVGKPRLRDYPYFCGKCHSDIRDRHIGSVHGANGLPHCVSCHGAHDVAEPEPAAIITEQACSKCHTYEKAAAAQQMLERARVVLDEIDAFERNVERIPSVLDPLHQLQRDLQLQREDVVSTFHSFRIGDIEQIKSNADRVLDTVEKLREREQQREETYARERPIILVLVGFFVLCTLFGYFVYHDRGATAGHSSSPAADHD